MRCVPSADKMAALEVMRERLRSCEADKRSRHELAAETRAWGSILDIPRRRGIHRGHGDVGFFEGPDHPRERLSDFS